VVGGDPAQQRIGVALPHRLWGGRHEGISPGANALNTATAVKAKIAEFKRAMPEGYDVAYPKDSTEFIKLHDFDANEVVDPDAIIAQAAPNHASPDTAAVSQQTTADSETEALLKSLGM
jgi:hypothetical protein